MDERAFSSVHTTDATGFNILHHVCSMARFLTDQLFYLFREYERGCTRPNAHTLVHAGTHVRAPHARALDVPAPSLQCRLSKSSSC